MVKIFTTRSEARKCKSFLLCGEHPKWVAEALDASLRRSGWALTMRIMDGLGVHHYILHDNGRFAPYQFSENDPTARGREGELWIVVQTKTEEAPDA